MLSNWPAGRTDIDNSQAGMTKYRVDHIDRVGRVALTA